MTRPHGSPASRQALAEWERGAFSRFREMRDATTPVDDLLPEDPLDHRDELRAALALIDAL